MQSTRTRVLALLTAGACAALLGSGCHRSPYDIARSDDEGLRSRADTLLLLVSIANSERSQPEREPEREPAIAPRPSFVEAHRIVDVTLAVDGKPLGKFRTVQGAQAHAAGAPERTVTAERDAALVRADFAELYDATTLKTVGDWVKALGRTISTGSHVLEVVGVTLTSESGAPVTYPARAFLPFSVEDGAKTTFAGRADLVLPSAVLPSAVLPGAAP